MFNNTKNRFPYAHTKHFFLKLIAKKYGNQCCTLQGGYCYANNLVYIITNYIKLPAANANNFGAEK
jgi:hypothetical protein